MSNFYLLIRKIYILSKYGYGMLNTFYRFSTTLYTDFRKKMSLFIAFAYAFIINWRWFCMDTIALGADQCTGKIFLFLHRKHKFAFSINFKRQRKKTVMDFGERYSNLRRCACRWALSVCEIHSVTVGTKNTLFPKTSYCQRGKSSHTRPWRYDDYRWFTVSHSIGFGFWHWATELHTLQLIYRKQI